MVRIYILSLMENSFIANISLYLKQEKRMHYLSGIMQTGIVYEIDIQATSSCIGSMLRACLVSG